MGGWEAPHVHMYTHVPSLRKKEKMKDALKVGNMTLVHARMCKNKPPPKRSEEAEERLRKNVCSLWKAPKRSSFQPEM